MDRPGCSGWDELTVKAALRMKHVCNVITRRIHRQPKRQKSTVTPRRGDFITLRCGVSYGGGQTRPGNLVNTKRDEALLKELNESEEFRRISGFASCTYPPLSLEFKPSLRPPKAAFAMWAPDLHQYYEEKLRSLYEHDASLQRPFSNSIFSAATYNLGPHSICFLHTDFANLAFGWCSIVSLGSFDPTKGGHLILFQCCLAIEFPAGSLILFPSAAITHANTQIQHDEERYSLTQYSAGGLFRWVEQGFQTVEDYTKGMSKRELADLKDRNSLRWEEGLALLPLSVDPAPLP